MAAAKRDYSRLRVVVALLVILVVILFDHVNSTTFARNSGQGSVETSYTQRDASACAPCGAPCPSTIDE